ncbi:gp26 baseplate hub subunit [Yersinia phage phiR1-RT]|uniref:Gp26 baseplate hub subunit n=1 Tax=Yersinia phage phiR1-RT TaxID=1206558 RepID=I7K349_BPPR1|nr:baseplate hub [Yersinia phage phiR1-RT]CCI88766.1 gp26 baseplate hub subunit [Yersinia phage phiR1-RT]
MYNYTFDVSLKDKTIKCRAFTLEEYRDLLKAKADGKVKDVVLDLIRKCSNATDLSKAEAEVVLIKLWAYSLGDVNFISTHVCTCGNKIDVPISINSIQYPELEDIWHDFGQFKIKFKQPKLFDNENVINMVFSCIDFLLIDKEEVKIEDLTDIEIQDLYNFITIEMISEISAKLTKAEAYIALPIVCKCGESSVKLISGLKSFMEML